LTLQGNSTYSESRKNSIGTLPFPSASKPGSFFDGWVYASGAAVKETDKITGATTLKAKWSSAAVAKIDVDFTGNITAVGTNATAVPLTGGDKGYKFTYGSSGHSGTPTVYSVKDVAFIPE